ncbi:MAG: hypothetical protein HKN12_04715 [Gemmatimonadetes bacterium]|nr:hypothetical protein [Gemmatimonadota bacterium]
MSAARFGAGCVAVAVLYAVMYAVWYPPTFAIIDESTYVSTALTYREGTVFSDVAGVQNISEVRTPGGHAASKFGPLWPAALVPWLALGWKAVFAATLVVHLVGFVLFLRLVRGAGLPDAAALLYLAHPTLVLYSRTVMSDSLAGVLVLAAWVAWRESSGDRPRAAVWAGLWLGLSVLVRFSNGVLAGLFLVGALLERGRGARRRLGALVAGGILPALALAAYNQVVFGKWWRGSDGYRDDRAGIGMEGQFSADNLVDGLAHYGLALGAVWPLLVLAPLFYRGRDARLVRVAGYGFTLFFCFYYYRDAGAGALQTAVAGLRFLIPVLPFFLLAYGAVISGLLARTEIARGVSVRGARAAFVAVALVLLAGSGAVHARHHRFLSGVSERQAALHAATPPGSVVYCDTAARELLHDAWGDRTAVRSEFRGRWDAPPPSKFAGRARFVALAGGDDSLAALRRAWGVPVVLSDPRGAGGVTVWEILETGGAP